MLKKLILHSKLFVTIASLVLLLVTFSFLAVKSREISVIQLNRALGITALILLIATLLPGLIKVFFPTFKLNSFFLIARRYYGLATFFIALVHAALSFYLFFHLSISGIFLLTPTYQLAFLAGLLAIFVLAVLAISDINFFKNWLGFGHWKALHRTVYLAAILIIFHTFLRGSNFQNNFGLISLTFTYILLTLVVFEVVATMLMMERKQEIKSIFLNIVVYLSLTIILSLTFYLSFLRLLR